MQKISLFIFLFYLLLSPLHSSASFNGYNRRLSDSVQMALESFPELAAARIERLDSLEHLRRYNPVAENRIMLGDRLGRNYIKENVDTAIMYWVRAYRDALNIKKDTTAQRLVMQVYAAMPLCGVAIEAIDGFSRFKPEKMSPELRRYYWLNAAELYYNVQLHYPKGDFKSMYLKKTKECLDSLYTYYNTDSPVRNYIKAQQHILSGEMNLAVATFVEALPGLETRPELYDAALETAAGYYRGRPDYRQQYESFVLRRLLVRLNQGRVIPSVFAEAGEILCEEGEREIGSRLISMALDVDDGVVCPFRGFDRSKYVNYLYRVQENCRIWIWIVCLSVFLLLIGAVIIVIKLGKRIALLESDNITLKSNLESEVKERGRLSGVMELLYLSNEQLGELNVYVSRKLKTGQVKDLHSEIVDGKYVQQLNVKFFEVFDSIFLECYPNFVEELNSLLLPDKELALLPGERMSPEMRIAAFLRIGLTDSSRLSKLMGLSVNTIYTYRNRLKGRAKNRETFEANLAALKY
ncbi:MAG: hypothetical protein K2L84_06105 [Muribaculaceae bacterium]|nr:hypothetical protein [Muribaculaceae bacterium]